MGMPEIISSNISRHQAITDIIASVSMEEMALSEILKAESEKIKAAVALPDSQKYVLSVNSSVDKMLQSATKFETILQYKLKLFEDCICPSPSPCPDGCICFEQMRNVIRQIITLYSNDVLNIDMESGDNVSGRPHSLIPGPDNNPLAGLFQLADSQGNLQEAVSICRIAAIRVTSATYNDSITYLPSQIGTNCELICSNAVNDYLPVGEGAQIRAGQSTVAQGTVRKSEAGMTVIVDMNDLNPVFVSNCKIETIKLSN